MFANDPNLFLTYKDISYLFETANLRLERINQWFISNKLSLNVSKTKYSFFHKPSKREDIPLLLPKLKVNNSEVERSESLKFLGLLLKNTLIILKAKLLKTSGCSLLSLDNSYIHSYINYGNITWGSVISTNLKKYTVNRNMLPNCI